jgi:NADPH-dependent ferric siderophore reductase
VWKSTTEGTFDLCVVLHGQGPGSRWAERCAVADPLEISRSRALPIALDPAAKAHLFFGDETSIASAEALIRALSAGMTVISCFEVSSMERQWPEAELARPGEICWLERAGRPGAALVSWLTQQSLPPANSTTAYVTGEAWLCAMVDAHLVRERGFHSSAVRAMPYWKTKSRSP